MSMSLVWMTSHSPCLEFFVGSLRFCFKNVLVENSAKFSFQQNKIYKIQERDVEAQNDRSQPGATVKGRKSIAAEVIS